jgi:hypothetical protein
MAARQWRLGILRKGALVVTFELPGACATARVKAKSWLPAVGNTAGGPAPFQAALVP